MSADQRRDTVRALDDLLVVDLTMAWAGPMVTRVLAEHGARIVKIEGASHMDRWRGGTTPQRGTHRYPDNDPGERPWDRNAFFNTQNRHKQSLALDLKSERGKAIFRGLADQADLVVENFSAGAMQRLGLDHDVLTASNPSLIMVSLPAFGRTGPEAGQVAHGPTIEAAAGNLMLQGYQDGEPLASGLLAWGDPIAGMNGAVAALAAVTYRDLTGNGVHVDLSHVEAAIPFNLQAVLERTVNGRTPGAEGNRDPQQAPQGAYPCRGDDRWMVCTCPDDEAWHRLAGLLDDPRLASADLSSVTARWTHHDLIDEVLAGWSIRRSRSDAIAELRAIGLPAAPVQDAADLLADPHLAARGAFQTITHPDAGSHPYPGMPWISTERPWMEPAPAPRFGEHNAEVLRDLLGLDEAAIDALAEAQVIADTPHRQGD